MPDDDLLGSSVTYADPTEGWTAQPVDGDPFAVPDSSSVPDSSVTRNRPVLAGHVAAAPTADQNYTPKYLAARPQGSISSYDPSLSERLQQGVSEAGQALGQPVEGAERMGGFARQAAEMAPVTGNILQGNEAMRSYNAGDPWGTLLHGAMALPIPGAPQEGAVARKISPLGFYSHGADVAANLSQQRGTTQQLVAALQKEGVKPAELKAAGLDDLSDMPPTTSREELADMFHRTQPPLQETQLGDDKYEVSKDGQRWANPPKFGEYTLPGGQNYREVLMHLPPQEQQAYTVAYAGGPQFGNNFRSAEEAQAHINELFPGRNDIEVRPTAPNDARGATALTRDNFTSSHWDTPNVVAHLRLNDRTGQDGENLLHMEELQSDWGQGGRDKGFQDPDKMAAFDNYMADAKSRMAAGIRQDGLDDGLSEDVATRVANNFVSKVDPHHVATYLNEHDKMKAAYETSRDEPAKLPSAPYVTNTQQWTDLGLKRALIEAANGGYSHLSWTPGEDQAARYGLEKHISDLSYSPHSGSLQARAVGGGRAMDERGVAPEDLHTYVGQEVAAKLLAQPQGPHFSLPDLHSDPNYAPQWAQGGWRTLSGQDLKVGGEGMKGYYDSMVPKSLMKIAKKLDPNAKLGTSTFRASALSAATEPDWMREAMQKTVPSMEITPLMRERIKQGLPQYQRGGRVGFADGGAPDDGGLTYPMAPRSEWYGEANYDQTGGRMESMSPDAFLSQARPLDIDEASRDNIEDLKSHINRGGTLDPLNLYANGKEDGRHRAVAAKELGISQVPVITWRPPPPQPMTPPAMINRPPTGLMSEEEALQRQREGLSQRPPGEGEWTGGRIAMADGGALEAVDYDPFPPAPQVQDSDVARAKGFPEPRSPMHARLAALGENPAPPPQGGFAQIDRMVQEGNAAHPDAPAPTPPEPQVYGGRWGQAAERGFQKVAGAIGSAQDWAGGKLEQGVSGAAGALGVPNPELLGRDVRAAIESPMLGDVAGAPRLAEEPRPRLGQVGSDVAHAAAPASAQIMDINGVKRHIDPEFPESRVGTSVPKNLDADAAIDAEQAAHANNKMHVGMELAAQAPSSYGKAVADRVRDGRIPYVKVAAVASDAAVQEALIEHMKNNLLGLYNRVSPDVRSGSKLWYEGANSRSANIAKTHDIPHENAAGVVAAMSPQKDWDQNVTLADWVAHTAGTTADDATMSPEMTDWVNRYALRKDQESVVTDPATGKETRFNAKTGEPMHPASVSQQDVQRQLAEVNGVPWGHLTPDQKAFYTRAYYEAHGPPDHLMPIDDRTGQPAHWIDDKGDRKYGYYINNPDGTHDGVLARYGDEMVNVKGQPIPVSWGSTGEVANAIQAFHAQSMSDVSQALGDGHKVRSFYNNIIAPWSKKGDLTSDTHAVAAALLRPLGAGSPEAASGMGAAAPGNAETGLKGFYPHVAEAYRRAAKQAGILPREMQSITWEALRGLWSPREKMAKTNVKKGFTSPTDITNGIWQQYKNGQISMDDAHNAILGQHGEKINPPRWFETFRP